MLFTQGRDLSGQRPDETNAVCRRAGNEVVVPTVRHSVYGGVLPVHALKVAFLPSDINLIVAPNEPVEKVTFLKSTPSAGSKIENYFLSSKVFTILSARFLFS